MTVGVCCTSTMTLLVVVRPLESVIVAVKSYWPACVKVAMVF